MTDLNEIELLQKLARGDSLAFAQLVNVYHHRLLHFSMHYLNNREQARDVVQDVFSVVWEDHEKFSEVKNLSSWLFTLTKNQCLKKIEYLKVRQKHANTLQYRQLEVIKDSLAQLDTSPIIFEEINKIIKQILEKLPSQSRQIFEMSRFENKKNREIAEELNISIKTVEAAVTKSLKLLRPALKHYLPIVFF
ncbi:RNA polymerase sigma-70 factor [Draconibacterium sediminis]|uniref:ECF subfamily RNA polymerase sigma-24 factor n=1 Tax=Draconibacterium sediminis TaxID=1544798 RepID=A0A0D8JE33_9BACT|nr:RNA polymerase sigma-70 factor [Draconibacterium sediminis]KJF45180.1 ECF subfamily RNA polymerase sigma-24 factor [Draconibacterium sediminis]